MNVEQAVRDRYARAANDRVDELCCPVDYDSGYLEIIPQEIIDRDYGCGDPSKHLRGGETVLDLGSGSGKICYIAAQVVGPRGRVIGVDMNDEMLALARSYRCEIGDRLGYHNVSFRKGRIQDLALDYEKLEARLATEPVRTPGQLEALETWKEQQRNLDPMIPSESVDVVVSNCVLNLVRNEDKQELFREIHRVLRLGGRAVISDIVSDETLPEHMVNDPELWSGCLSGAFREDRFLAAFEEAGFYGIRVLHRDAEPWQVIEGVEFRSVTVEAFKGKEGPCLERRQAVIYKGPWRSVTDDDGHTLQRGRRMAVCDKTFRIYTREPYAPEIVPVPAYEDVPLEEATPFDCNRGAEHDAGCCGPDRDGC
jgi:ubiquinone/menaquinone biosynthesis C-methylase UbiE